MGSALRVLFWNGIEVTVPPELAVWIPASQHERIVREIQRQLQVHCIHTTTTHCSPPVVQRCCVCTTRYCHSLCKCHCSMMPLQSICLPTAHHNHTEGKQSQMDELNRKVALQLQDLQTSSTTPTRLLSSPFSDREDDKDREGDGGSEYPELETVSQAVNTDLSFLGRTRAEPLAKPSWRYWRRSPAEPHYKKPGNLLSGSSHY